MVLIGEESHHKNFQNYRPINKNVPAVFRFWPFKSVKGAPNGSKNMIFKIWLDTRPEVNISSYPVTPVTGLIFFSRAEIFKLGCFVQKYSDLGVSCRNICQVPFRVTQSEKCILEKVTQMVL